MIGGARAIGGRRSHRSRGAHPLAHTGEAAWRDTSPCLSELADRHRALLDETLQGFLAEQFRRWNPVHPTLGDAVGTLSRVVGSGGKRIRPLLCYLTFVGTTDRDDTHVARACAALEILHTFAILQDDIIDGSPLRRGVASLHVAYADAHGRDGRRGDATKFGENASTLVADLAFVFADQLMREYEADAREIFDQLRVEVAMGQILDVFCGAERVADLNLARLISCYKTAKYTVERPIHLGAVIAGAPEGFLADVSRFALPLGSAFQLRDEILGAFGDVEVTGKPVGEDFREGKPTVLWTYAMSAAGPREREILARYGDGPLEAEDMARIRDVIVSTGALENVECELGRLFAEAQSALDSIPMERWAVDALRDLSQAMAYRDF